MSERLHDARERLEAAQARVEARDTRESRDALERAENEFTEAVREAGVDR